jgi:hypothetical protein
MVNHVDQLGGSSEVVLEHEGMSLRDHFAIGPMSDVELETLRQAFAEKFPNEPPSIARIRFFRADTMLEVRAQWYNEKGVPTPLPMPPNVVIPAQPGEDE